MKSKLVIVALLAFAAGGTCPSDVNNDGTVGINDFLQLLGDWGPCPSPPKVVAFDGHGARMFRVWSDGTIQFLMFHFSTGDDCFDCELATPVFTWLDVGTTPVSDPVDMTLSNPYVKVAFADGSTWYRQFDFVSSVDPACVDAPLFIYCTFEWVGDWIEFGS